MDGEDRFYRLAACEGKERFDSPILARRAAKRKRGRAHYRCKRCGGWHVGRDNNPAKWPKPKRKD
jgi:predicted SprT family Zn-dependent metalloprotease